MNDRYDDAYKGLRASDGVGGYDLENREEADDLAAPYRRSAYGSGSSRSAYSEYGEESYPVKTRQRADQAHREREGATMRKAAAAERSASREAATRQPTARKGSAAHHPVRESATAHRPVARKASARDAATQQGAARGTASVRETPDRQASAHKTPSQQPTVRRAPTAQEPQTGAEPLATPAPKKSKGKRIAVIVAVVAAVLVIGGAGLAFAYMNNISGNLHAGVEQDLREALVQTDMANEPFYILLLGTDQSKERDEDGELGGVYRSDVIMLTRIDPVQKKVSIVSIPRDTMVDLGGEYGIQKINAARAFGGPALAVETISDFAGVKISHFAEINFDGFEAVVDSLGGVEVDVPIEIDDEDAGGALEAGLQTLNGEQALILCRSRNTFTYLVGDPDMMRAANQRMVLSAIAKKILSSDVATIANTVSTVSQYVTTDLELNDIIGIAQTMKDLDPESDIYTATMPGTSEYVTATPEIDEGYYEIADGKGWAEMMKRMDQGLPPSESAIVEEKTGVVLATAGEGAVDKSEKVATVDVKNGTKRDGLANHAKELLNEAGFIHVTAGQAVDKYKYPYTLVIYDDESQAYEAGQIANALGQGKASLNDGTYLFDANFLVIIGEDWQDDGSAASGGSASASASGSNASGSESASASAEAAS